MIKGQIISGEFGKVIARQKSDSNIELGQLMVAVAGGEKVLLQVYDISYASQISQQNLELISGIRLEESEDTQFMDPHLRNYKLAHLKNILTISGTNARSCKLLPDFFSTIRDVDSDDLSFISRPHNPLFLGQLRSGSKTLDADISLPGEEVLSHHVLIPATTGRGKSNLMSVVLWGLVDEEYCANLVLDPHDEYYGRTGLGLKDHPSRERVEYYSLNPLPGCRSLKINIRLLRPSHFNGAVDWSPAQRDALHAYHRRYGDEWIEAIILEKEMQSNLFNEATLGVLKRKLMRLLNIEFSGDGIRAAGAFDYSSGMTTIADIVRALEESKTVIIDTSTFSGSVEILIGSMVASEVFSRYRSNMARGTLKDKPVVSIVLEEAPRVLGKEVLDKGPNIFSTIAREGRKFKVGLVAITQLPSLIPRQILANMNTKIILGIEMAPERQAIIESASQDLSQDARAIASLDKGEAIITSNFARFATPIRIPLFSEFVKKYASRKVEAKKDYSGIAME